MISLPGYTLTNPLIQHADTAIYRGHGDAHQTPVLVKVPTGRYPTQETIAQLQHEYDILNKHKTQGIVRLREQVPYQHAFALVMDDPGGELLSEHPPFHLQDILNIVLQIASALHHLHQHQLVYCNTSPNSILFNPNTHQITLIDFGLSAYANTRATGAPTGALSYIAPEQTGRLNRSIDHRTDFYALGILLYECLVGTKPFETTDPVELVHAHIARTPKTPSQCQSNVPQTISNIVMKLLSKTAEERYQSTQGLISDLEQCKQQWQANKTIESFVLGQNERVDQLRIPNKLYGRETEQQAMHNAFEQVKKGDRRLALIGGHSGVGKTALVDDLHESILQQNAYFIAGKFDQLQRNVPYASLIQAFQDLVRQLLTESQDQLDVWRETLSQTLGANARIITDVIPEVEHIIGPQAPVRSLPPAESQNRFNLVFRRFVSVFARPQHPLIIFLDDLQWADMASLDLIRLLLTDVRTAHLFILGSYREDEVHDNHPLFLMRDELNKTRVPIDVWRLKPLSVDHVTQLISDTLHSAENHTQPLAHLIYEYTEGNPFFIHQYLTLLYDRHLLTFDPKTTTWQWDLDHIRSSALTDNVISLMVSRIQDLSAEAQNILVLSSCIGNRFDVETLAPLCNGARSELHTQIWQAVHAGLLVPLDNTHAVYQFLHDRVQQAAYTLISKSEREILHLKIGQLIQARCTENQIEDNIFNITDQMNAGQAHMTQEDERLELAHLNHMAGEKALTATAYDSALHYFQTGTALLPKTAWQKQYDLALMLNQQQGICQYLLGQFEDAEKRFDTILQHVQTDMDRVRIYMVKVRLYIHREETAKALALGLEGLRLLNISLSQTPSKITVAKQLLKVKWLLRKHSIDHLIHLPDMTDERPQLAIELLAELLSPAYFASAELYALLDLTMMALVLQHGNTESAPFVYAQYGAIISGGLGQYDTAYAFGEMALELCIRYQQSIWVGRTYLTRGAILKHWRTHAKENLLDLQQTYDRAIENGDHLYAIWANRFGTLTRIFLGTPLSKTAEFHNQATNFARQIRHEEFTLVAVERLIQTLLGNETSFDEITHLNDVSAAGDSTSLVTYRIYRMMALYLLGDYTQAQQMAQDATSEIFATFGQLLEVEYRFYHALTLMQLPSHKKHQKILNVHLKKMNTWATSCPENFQARACLLQAEYARCRGHIQNAMDQYDQAIEWAQKNDQVHIAALANERAGIFFEQTGRLNVARTYLLEARYGYLRWGAIQKVQLLEQTHASMFSSLPESTPIGQTNSGELDLLSVMKASQVLSGEITFDRLLDQLINIVIENAGAQRGFLILEQDQELIIEMSVDINQKTTTVKNAIPLSNCKNLSEAIVQYVARTREHLVINNATQEGHFTDDPYVIQHQPKSILCMPIEHQNKLTGVLYLENNLTTDTFTPDRLEMLNLLCAQAAISIENARLYAQLEDHSRTLEQRVEERTRSLKETQDRLITEMERELQTAHNLQMSLMPETPPTIKGLDVSGRCIPATHVGGDFFHYFHPLPERFFISLADVTGHAMEAAIPVVMFDGVLDSQMERGGILTDMFARLNHTLHRKLGDRTFVCFVMAEIDPSSHAFRMSNAGCPYPFHYRAQTHDVVELQIDAYPLGVRPDSEYHELRLTLQPGDYIIFCSDGIIEAENAHGEIFDYERTITTIREACDINTSADGIIDWLINAVDAFRGDTSRQDDMTCVVIKVE